VEAYVSGPCAITSCSTVRLIKADTQILRYKARFADTGIQSDMLDL